MRSRRSTCAAMAPSPRSLWPRCSLVLAVDDCKQLPGSFFFFLFCFQGSGCAQTTRRPMSLRQCEAEAAGGCPRAPALRRQDTQFNKNAFPAQVPSGLLPVMELNGEVTTESDAIMARLEEVRMLSNVLI